MSNKERFEEIICEIKELLEEAINLVPKGVSRSRAESYWYAHMIVNVTEDHGYMSSSMCSMQDTLEEFDEIEEEDENEENETRSWMSQEEEDDYIANNPLPREYSIEDEDYDYDAGRPAHMRDEDWD